MKTHFDTNDALLHYITNLLQTRRTNESIPQSIQEDVYYLSTRLSGSS